MEEYNKFIFLNSSGCVEEVKALSPHMTAGEVILFRKYLDKIKVYIEFGCGGSTHEALSHDNVEQLYSIESDRQWVDKLRRYPAISTAENAGRLYLFPVDIGPVKEWGAPVSLSHALKWPDYYWGIWSNLPKDADLILIDGRFRVAAALIALLMCHPNRPFIIIHDFVGRDEYNVLYKFLDNIDSVDSLFVFTPKENIVFSEVLTVLHEYLFYPFDRTLSSAPDVLFILNDVYSIVKNIESKLSS